MRRRSPIVLILLICGFNAWSQSLPGFFQELADSCKVEYSQLEIENINRALKCVEDYAIANDFLADNTGKSYRAFYQRVVDEQGLDFLVATPTILSDSLDFSFPTRCQINLLSESERAKLTTSHADVIEGLKSGLIVQISNVEISERLVELLSDSDFELSYFKNMTLNIIFRYQYLYHSQMEFDKLLPQPPSVPKDSLDVLVVHLDEKNQIHLKSNIVSITQTKQAIYQYISVQPSQRAVEISASNDALYSSYRALVQAVSDTYDNLQKDQGSIPVNIFYTESQ